MAMARSIVHTAVHAHKTHGRGYVPGPLHRDGTQGGSGSSSQQCDWKLPWVGPTAEMNSQDLARQLKASESPYAAPDRINLFPHTAVEQTEKQGFHVWQLPIRCIFWQIRNTRVSYYAQYGGKQPE